jgi:multiple sugar transport system permease protein
MPLRRAYLFLKKHEGYKTMSIKERLMPGKPLHMKRSKMQRKEILTFYVLLAPWLLSLLVFFVFGVGFSFFLSFMQWDLLHPMKFVGFDNFLRMFTDTQRYFRDPAFFKSLGVTFLWVAISVPANLIVEMLLAVLMNVKLKGTSFYRTVYYLPSVVSAISVNMLWLWIFNYDYGLGNTILSYLGLPAIHWLGDPKFVLESLAIMSVWGAGNGALIFLAGLKGIPVELYEAADIDGARSWVKFYKVTLPMLSPVILFNVVDAVGNAFQTFMTSYVMTNGGPDNMTNFISLMIYKNAFISRDMGYASALSWISLVIIAGVTFTIFRATSKNIYYGFEG